MSRSKAYQRLLNSRRWTDTKRMVWQRAKGLCEACLAEGIISQGVDCHHIRPVESAHSPQEMERLCYDTNNIQLLCIPCHSKVHQEAKSHTKEQHQQREQERTMQRMERWRRPADDSDPRAPI